MIRNESAARGGVQAVHRALIIQKLLSERGSLSVTEAAAAIDVNPSSAQRILATLVVAGFAIQGAGRRYEPGPELLRPGVTHLGPLRAQLRAHLEVLFQRVGETVHLAVLIGTEVHHLDGIEAVWPLRMGLRTGVRIPAHLTSAGKVMLAELSDSEVRQRYLAGDGIADSGPSSMASFLRDLESTRKRGIGLNLEESNQGVAGMAVSLGYVNGSLSAFSLSLPIARYSDALASEYRTHLIEVSQDARRSVSF